MRQRVRERAQHVLRVIQPQQVLAVVGEHRQPVVAVEHELPERLLEVFVVRTAPAG